MLVGVHSIKQAIPSAAIIALSIPATYIAHRNFVSHHERQMSVLPLEFSSSADESIERQDASARRDTVKRLSSYRKISVVEAEQIAVAEQENLKFNEMFEGFYIQPELLEAAKVVGGEAEGS